MAKSKTEPKPEPRFYISDCGQYIARRRTGRSSAIGFDVLAADGSCIWLDRRYVPTGWEDTDPRYRYPEFEHMVGAASFMLGKRRGVEIFELSFMDMDTAKLIEPLKGNCVLRSYTARFSRALNLRTPKPIREIP